MIALLSRKQVNRDGTITLDLRGISYPVKLGPFKDTVIDEIIGLITSEGQKDRR